MAFTPSSGSFPGRLRRGGKFPPRPKEEHRINEYIRIPKVRLIGPNGEQVGIVDTREAMRMAQDAKLDLVEIAPNAQPPVCKILDYGKFKYEKKKKEAIAKKKQVVIKIKEIQLRPNTDQHDLDFKFKNARGFLEEGDKVKATLIFRGRQMAHPEHGRKIMEQLIEATKDVASVEQNPKMEGRRMTMILAPFAKKEKKIPSAQREKEQLQQQAQKGKSNDEADDIEDDSDE